MSRGEAGGRREVKRYCGVRCAQMVPKTVLVSGGNVSRGSLVAETVYRD